MKCFRTKSLRLEQPQTQTIIDLAISMYGGYRVSY
eukprot:COSAG02_NODE_51525_length_313_cov_1.200935_1_plen_34_part_10